MSAIGQPPLRGTGPSLPANPRPESNPQYYDPVSTIISNYSEDDDSYNERQYSPSEYTDESSPSPFLPIQSTEDATEGAGYGRSDRVIDKTVPVDLRMARRADLVLNMPMINSSTVGRTRDSYAFVSDKAGISLPTPLFPAAIPTPPLSSRILSDGSGFRLPRPFSRSSKPAALQLRKSNGSTAAASTFASPPLTRTPTAHSTSIQPITFEARSASAEQRLAEQDQTHSASTIPKLTRLVLSEQIEPSTTAGSKPVSDNSSQFPTRGASLPAHPAAQLEMRKMKSFFSTREKEAQPYTARRWHAVEGANKTQRDGSPESVPTLPPTPPSLPRSPIGSSRPATQSRQISKEGDHRGDLINLPSDTSNTSLLTAETGGSGSTIKPVDQLQGTQHHGRQPLHTEPPPHSKGVDKPLPFPQVSRRPIEQNGGDVAPSLLQLHVEKSNLHQPPQLPPTTYPSFNIADTVLDDARADCSAVRPRTLMNQSLDNVASARDQLEHSPPTAIRSLPPNPRPPIKPATVEINSIPSPTLQQVDKPQTGLQNPPSERLLQPPTSSTSFYSSSTPSSSTARSTTSSTKSTATSTLPPARNLTEPTAGPSSTTTPAGSEYFSTPPQHLASPPPTDLQLPHDLSLPTTILPLVEAIPPPPASNFIAAHILRPSQIECHADHGRWHGPRRNGGGAACMLCQRLDGALSGINGDGSMSRMGGEGDVLVEYHQCVYCALWVCGGCKANVDALMPGRRGGRYGVGNGIGGGSTNELSNNDVHALRSRPGMVFAGGQGESHSGVYMGR